MCVPFRSDGPKTRMSARLLHPSRRLLMLPLVCMRIACMLLGCHAFAHPAIAPDLQFHDVKACASIGYYRTAGREPIFESKQPTPRDLYILQIAHRGSYEN